MMSGLEVPVARFGTGTVTPCRESGDDVGVGTSVPGSARGAATPCRERGDDVGAGLPVVWPGSARGCCDAWPGAWGRCRGRSLLLRGSAPKPIGRFEHTFASTVHYGGPLGARSPAGEVGPRGLAGYLAALVFDTFLSRGRLGSEPAGVPMPAPSSSRDGLHRLRAA